MSANPGSFDICGACRHTFSDHFHGHLGVGRNPERCIGGGCLCTGFLSVVDEEHVHTTGELRRALDGSRGETA